MNVGSVLKWGCVSLLGVLVLLKLLNHAGLIEEVSSYPLDAIILTLIAGLLVRVELAIARLGDRVKRIENDVKTLKRGSPRRPDDDGD